MRGESSGGRGVLGISSSGWAGWFDGKVHVERFIELAEIGTPGPVGANKAKLFIRDNGSGHTQLCVRFSNGKTRVIATA